MASADVKDWLLLYHTTGMNNRRLKTLVQCLGSPSRVLEVDRSTLLHIGTDANLATEILKLRQHETEAHARTERALRWLERPGHHLVLATDDTYPVLLRQTDDNPVLLFVKGHREALLGPMFAIVGSRNCSHYGRQLAHRFSVDLSRSGLVIVSGLASGIDTAAHRGALDAGGSTVAVLGTGLLNIYPPSNKALAEQILGDDCAGALVSELPLNAPPDAHHFPRRNRIISGVSAGTCVVEASMRSGSLITARMALEQNRQVFAVPGSVNNPGSRGCHRLLREGAALAENAADILGQLTSMLQGQLELMQGQHADLAPEPDSKPSDSLLRLISDDPLSHDRLLTATGLSAGELAMRLLPLELSGQIQKEAGRWIRCRNTQ
jgi:DNA processing protein